jgi:hypothetical protein
MTKMRYGYGGRLMRYGLFAACICAASTSPIAASPFEMPALTKPANSEHHAGKVIWRDLQTTDLSRAKEFYGGLFGWDFRDYHAAGTDYAVAVYGGRPIAGLVQRAIREGEQRRSAWLPFISVRDVDETVRIALLHHAQIRSAPENLPLRGRQALLTDPEGVSFGLEASSSGDPPDTVAAPGTWLLTSLFERDPGNAALFYQQVFGYDVRGLPADGGFERVQLFSSGHARVVVDALQADAPEIYPQWVNFVRVADSVDATAKTLKLGGRVLVKAQRDNQGNTSVILADPTGAPFGVIELPPAQALSGSP